MSEDVSAQAEALTRAILYVSVALSTCKSAPRVGQESVTVDAAVGRRGHWGTLPTTALCLANAALIDPTCELIIGPGHAGIAQIALAWLSGDLEELDASYRQDVDGLDALCADFPDFRGIGSEVSPRLSAGRYVGGLIGGALAFGVGFSRTANSRCVVLVGDGELETPTTAASWMPASVFAGDGLIPVVNLNEYRMGSRSAVSNLSDEDLGRYFGGQGWAVRIIDGTPSNLSSHQRFQNHLMEGARRRQVLVMRNRKGVDGYWSTLDDLAVTSEPLHKAPLELLDLDVRSKEHEAWLGSYQPWSLFTARYEPLGLLADALKRLNSRKHGVEAATAAGQIAHPNQEPPSTLADAVILAVERVREIHEVWVLSPDELASNGLTYFTALPSVIEILAEEVLGYIQAGLAAGGVASLLVSYEAFATLLVPGMKTLLKTLAQLPAGARRSVNLLLTSYGWENSFTHGDPTFTSLMICSPQEQVRVSFPHTTGSLYKVLANNLQSSGRVNVVIAGKRQLRSGASNVTADGFVIYGTQADRIMLAMGDLAANVALDARAASPVPLSVCVVENPRCLMNEALWDAIWPSESRRSVLFLTITHAWAVEATIPARVRPFVCVLGWVDESAPLNHDERLKRAGFTSESVSKFFAEDKR